MRTTPQASYRSGLEEKVARQLSLAGIAFEFEKLVLKYTRPASNHKYTPDFTLPNGVVIESKGLFTTKDRQKMLLVKEQHPALDIRLLFQNAKERIAKGSKTTYAMWAEKYGFPWAHREVPAEWINEVTHAQAI
jgi:hypothetical protein